ncbi:HepT-like ribonuclease domain-containing protein [Phormidium sp. CCY1219]|uniref:HepT-like ribonuclease domain-containing protein n=1 Tax=Phormidium sp. CCY1219 TaxID=2886104 RepID=UPI002D1F62FB|nr:HepT-like ribonuclease domain-containing protein [Phormidium sp. CCY1219]MEB3830817.1 DUF86 domain-containing protein [Phormidium sp. CCY1219]
MPPRDLQYLLDILISAKLALSYVSRSSWSDFLANIQLQDSVVRRLEIIGEAERRLSEKTRISLSRIPFIMMRNRIIQEYDKIVLEVVWETIHNDLPPLVEALEKIVPEEPE